MRYRLVNISNNLADYPDSVEDTENFPHLVKYVEDEQLLMIVQLGTDNVWPGDEFFHMVDFKEFTTNVGNYF